MVTFNIEQPLIQKDINAEINAKRQESENLGKEDKRDGLISLSVGLAILYFLGFSFDRASDPYRLKFIFVIIWSTYTFAKLFIPLILNSRMDKFITYPYTGATLDKIHDCEAFINMPGMEKHKEYVENIKVQGRELTNFECDEIIKYWKSLANK